MKERIQKILANAGLASRRNIEEMVRQGRVSVNGKVMTELPVLVDPQRDRVVVDDEPIRLDHAQAGPRVYIIMNKPRGVYTTNVAQGAQKRAIDLLPPDFSARVYPVGRLDAESRGLLLLTNDGDLTNHLTHPRYGVPKTYRATVEGRVDDRILREMEKGVWLSDPHGRGFKAVASHMKVIHREHLKTILEVILREGRNRQVRRMLAKFGHKVRDLVRVKMGPLSLEGLAPGEFRPLTPREIRQLREVGDRKKPKAATEEHEKQSGAPRAGAPRASAPRAGVPRAGASRTRTGAPRNRTPHSR